MVSTTFGQDLPADMATGYDGARGSRSEAIDVYLRPYPAGGAVTTAEDMAHMLMAMLGDRPDVVSPAVAETFVSTGFRSHPEVRGRTIGGLEEMSVAGYDVVGHSGDIAGFGAQLALVPEEGIGIFFAANTVDFELNARLVDEIVTLLVDPIPAGGGPEFVDLPPEDLEVYSGSYRWTRYSRSGVDKVLALFPINNFSVEAPGDGTLVVEIGGVDKRWVYRPIGDDAFAQTEGDRTVVSGIVVDPGDRISFTRDVGGDVAYVNFALSTIAGERTPWYLMGPAQLMAVGALLAVFILSLLVWAVTGWRRRARSGELGVTERRIRVFAIAQGLLLVVSMGAVVFGLLGPVPFGLPTTAVVGLALTSAAAVGGLLLVPAAVTVWRRGLLTSTERITLAVLAGAAPVFLWWVTYWNLFGFGS
jgi:hypothetical protein